jgi:hypothetical protein
MGGQGAELKGYSHRGRTQGDHQARVHSDQMVLVAVRQEAGPGRWRPKTLKGRAGKQLWAAKGPNRTRAKRQPAREVLLDKK